VPGPGQFAGVALICGGLGSLVLAGRRAESPTGRGAVNAALATGLSKMAGASPFLQGGVNLGIAVLYLA
jgi:hypothetical protein